MSTKPFDQIYKEVTEIPDKQFEGGNLCKQRIIDIIWALRGYLSEDGTTDSMNNLLREIGCKPQK